MSDGALYAFPSVVLPPKFISEAEAAGTAADEMYCLKLLENTGVVVVPGAFPRSLTQLTFSTHSLTHSLTTHSLTHSLTHSPQLNSPTHPLTQLNSLVTAFLRNSSCQLSCGREWLRAEGRDVAFPHNLLAA